MISLFHSIKQYSLLFSSMAIFLLGSYVSAITLTIPPSDGFQDIAVSGPQQIEGKTNLVYDYIQLATQYLWFSMIVICFVAVVYLGFKLMTNPAGSTEIKGVLKTTLTGVGIGLVVAMMSYTLVRLVINIL